MNINEIREPIQERSIKKKDKIVEAGFELICKKGYYNTNTAQIAKAAGVSTGIVYQYFKDKHDILLEGIKRYATDIFYPMINISVKDSITIKNLPIILNAMIKKFVENHRLSRSAHQEITSMIHSDEKIATFFYEHELYMTKKISEILIENGFNSENINEKVHISINLIDNLCHEIVYHNHDLINYDKMTDLVIKSICDLFNNI